MQMILFLLLTLIPSTSLASAVIGDNGTIQAICVRFSQSSGIVWFKGHLFNTEYEQEEDIGTVITESTIGLETSPMDRMMFQRYCKSYQYKTGKYTVSIYVNGKYEVFRGASYGKSVEIKLEDER